MSNFDGFVFNPHYNYEHLILVVTRHRKWEILPQPIYRKDTAAKTFYHIDILSQDTV